MGSEHEGSHEVVGMFTRYPARTALRDDTNAFLRQEPVQQPMIVAATLSDTSARGLDGLPNSAGKLRVVDEQHAVVLADNGRSRCAFGTHPDRARRNARMLPSFAPNASKYAVVSAAFESSFTDSVIVRPPP